MRCGFSRPVRDHIRARQRVAPYGSDEGDDQRSAEQHSRGWKTDRTRQVAGAPDPRHAGTAAQGQKLDQAMRDLPSFPECPSSAGQPQDQESQSLRGAIPRELGELGCLLPPMISPTRP